MTFEEFNNLFQNALNIAIKNAEEQLHRKLPSNDVQIILHGAGYSGAILDPLTVAKNLYIGKDKFYRIIDVSVIKISSKLVTIFVRASSHSPGTFDQTWNDPPGSGPFKQLIAQEIEIEDS